MAENARKELNERCIVAMVGDGINDAPVSLHAMSLKTETHVYSLQALASADVAIAHRSGSKCPEAIACTRPDV